MVRVNNLAETESVDSVSAKGLENQSQQSEKFGSIAVDSWNQIGKNSKDAAGKATLGDSKDSLTKDGLTKDGTALTFSDPFKKNLEKNPGEGSLDFSPAKPEIPADGGLKDKEVQGSEIMKKHPADGGPKDSESTGKKPLDGGPKDSESTGKKPLDGGPKDPAFEQKDYLQKL